MKKSILCLVTLLFLLQYVSFGQFPLHTVDYTTQTISPKPSSYKFGIGIQEIPQDDIKVQIVGEKVRFTQPENAFNFMDFYNDDFLFGIKTSNNRHLYLDSEGGNIRLNHNGGKVSIGEKETPSGYLLGVTGGVICESSLRLNQVADTNNYVELLDDFNSFELRSSNNNLSLKSEGGNIFLNAPVGNILIGATEISLPDKAIVGVKGGGVYSDLLRLNDPENTQNFVELYKEDNSFGLRSNNNDLHLQANGGNIIMNKHGEGNVTIGQGASATPQDYLLGVKGGIICEELFVEEVSNWPDYVFAKQYDLKPLSVLSKFIQENKHLPHLPSAKQIEEAGGFDVAEVQKQTLRTVEELTLHLIEAHKAIEDLSSRIEVLEKEISDK